MIQVNYEDYTERGFQRITKQFTRAGLNVESIEGDNRPKRESGFQVKSITYNFDSGQKLVMKAKAGGSFYQIRLNNKVLPIKNTENMISAMKEVIAHVKGTEDAFLKAKAKKEEKAKLLPPKITKRENVGVRKKIEAATAENNTVIASNETMQSEIVIADADMQKKQDKLATLQSELSALRAEGETLANELELALQEVM